MEVDYMPDEMNYDRSNLCWNEPATADAFDAGWRAACEAMAAKAPVKAPPGHIIDDQGNVRKVLGTLPLTMDGCAVMPGSIVFFPWFNGVAKGCVRYEMHGPDLVVFVESSTTMPDGRLVGVRTFMHDCYSTREAAELRRVALCPQVDHAT